MVDLAAALRRTASGDTEAFGEVVSRFQDMAVGYAYSVLGNSDDAQDAAQEAFVTAYIRIGDLRDASRFARWFRRILLTACRTVRRRRAMAEPTEGLRPHVDDTHSPSCRLEQAQTQREVQEAINSLSLANRIAVVLFYIRGYTVDEVAGFLEVPAGTIKRRLHDARKQLRKEMVGMVQEDLQGRRPTAQFRRQVLERIAHWERFGGTDEEKLDMVASDPDWIQLMEVEVSLEPMSSECRQIRRQIASMEACDEHYPENLDALAGMIGTMTPGRILDCGDACEARRDEAARIRQALEAWREETMAPGGPAGAIGQEVTDLLGQRTDEKVQLVDHLIGKLGDNGYRVYEDEDEDFELTESRIQHLEICNYNWGENVRVVLREIAAGKRLYEWHTPDGYNAHGDCRDRVPELRSRMAELAAWADGGRDDASPYAAILGDGTEEKRWLVASLCKHVAAQHAALPGGNPLPVPSA